jgi:hypothetical protein
MAIPARTSRPGTFFITSGTYNRHRLFQVERNAELLVETIQHYRVEGHYQLHAFVVMPDHLHLLLTPEETLERAVGLGHLNRGGFSHCLFSKLPSGSEASPTTASLTPKTSKSVAPRSGSGKTNNFRSLRNKCLVSEKLLP